MKMRHATVLLLAMPILAACSSSSRAPVRTGDASPTAMFSGCDRTPPAGAASIFDLRTLRRVQSVDCLGRVPLGMLNTTHMALADAAIDREVSGDMLRLSVVLAVRIGPGLDGSTGASYEWWFYTKPATDSATSTADHAASIKLALRFVAGGWGVYEDAGAGWVTVPGSTYHFGDHEVTVVAPLEPAWGMAHARSTFFRAVTESEGSVVYDDAGRAQPVSGFGDVYPPDLQWVEVAELMHDV